MKRSKFSDTQIVSILKQAEAGMPVKEVCRHFSDISYALLCIVGRNCNERRLCGLINQLLKSAFTASNQVVGGSSPSGRAK